MPFPVVCPSCGKQSNAPDNARGKRAKCGKCGTSFVVAEAPAEARPSVTALKNAAPPLQSKAAVPSDVDDLLGQLPPLSDADDLFTSGLSASNPPDAHELDELLGTVANTPAQPKTKACPMCGETILEAAKKCKHCGEMIGQTNSRKLKQGKQAANNYAGRVWWISAVVLVGFFMLCAVLFTNSTRRSAYTAGFSKGAERGNLDYKYGDYSPSSARSKEEFALQSCPYKSGTTDYGDFWKGFDDGYYAAHSSQERSAPRRR